MVAFFCSRPPRLTHHPCSACPLHLQPPPPPSDLHENVKEQLLLTAFQAWPVTLVTIPKHKHTQRSMGYAYVNFQSLDDGAWGRPPSPAHCARGQPPPPPQHAHTPIAFNNPIPAPSLPPPYFPLLLSPLLRPLQPRPRSTPLRTPRFPASPTNPCA